MTTTIQVSQDLLSELKSRKMFEQEPYEEVIWWKIFSVKSR